MAASASGWRGYWRKGSIRHDAGRSPLPPSRAPQATHPCFYRVLPARLRFFFLPCGIVLDSKWSKLPVAKDFIGSPHITSHFAPSGHRVRATPDSRNLVLKNLTGTAGQPRAAICANWWPGESTV